MKKAFVALGANLGNPVETLRAALDDMRALPGVDVLRVSRFYRTSPVDSSGPDYVNAVAAVTFEGTPEAFLHELQAIEERRGRVRPAGVHNAPRTLDLDLLEVEGEVRSTAFLTLPHPRMTERLFVLVPLSDVAPDWRAPNGERVTELIEAVRLADATQRIEPIEASEAVDSDAPRDER